MRDLAVLVYNIDPVLEIRQKINWPRFLFELALFHFELALPSLNRPFEKGTFSSHFLLWLMISF